MTGPTHAAREFSSSSPRVLTRCLAAAVGLVACAYFGYTSLLVAEWGQVFLASIFGALAGRDVARMALELQLDAPRLVLDDGGLRFREPGSGVFEEVRWDHVECLATEDDLVAPHLQLIELQGMAHPSTRSFFGQMASLMSQSSRTRKISLQGLDDDLSTLVRPINDWLVIYHQSHPGPAQLEGAAPAGLLEAAPVDGGRGAEAKPTPEGKKPASSESGGQAVAYGLLEFLDEREAT